MDNEGRQEKQQQVVPVVATLKWSQRHPYALALISAFVAFTIGVLAGGSSEPEGKPIATEAPATTGEKGEPTAEDEPPPAAEPKGKVRVASCDIGLTDDNYDTLIGSAELINRGAVPANVECDSHGSSGTDLRSRPIPSR